MAIRAVGAERYHDKHAFHKLLHGGKLTKSQVQAWALNRYCYQAGVPRKDAALMSRAHDREFRREWLHRIHDTLTSFRAPCRRARSVRNDGWRASRSKCTDPTSSCHSAMARLS